MMSMKDGESILSEVSKVRQKDILKISGTPMESLLSYLLVDVFLKNLKAKTSRPRLW